MHSTLVLVVLACTVVLIQAECPNGCSGRGSCSSKDMCQCYKNFQGNDCSERTCGFGYAHTDTSKGDLNMDGTIATSSVVTGSQVYPYGTWEGYNGGASADEGHFYMECANQGLCDRETGDCVCFDGFEGSACQRASCPNSCSNHGSCESISEFASTAAGTLFTKGVGTGAQTYNLWDAKVSYGCRCDPWFTGADCSQRVCKVGVDPMYYDTEQVTYETIHINIATSDNADWIRIRFWDYWGESYITKRIAGGSGITAALVEAALEALPNGVISDALECVDLAATVEETTFFSATVATIAGKKILCQFKSNPGALRLPEVYEIKTGVTTTITTTPLRGEDENLCNTLLTVATVSDISDADPAVFTLFGDNWVSRPTAPFLAKYNDQYMVVNTDATDKSVTITEKMASSAVAGLVADLYYSTSSLTTALTLTAASGSLLTITSNTYTAGDKIICENQILNVVSATTTTVTVDRPFMGAFETMAAISGGTGECFKISAATRTTPYVSECAGRGICDRESGVCSCFKGYTNDNCDKQSILAF